MALKKSELYSSLWSSCDEQRGGMDASQYKDYVLVLLFIKYVSDKYADLPFAPITIPSGASFNDMVALKGKPDIGDQILQQWLDLSSDEAALKKRIKAANAKLDAAAYAHYAKLREDEIKTLVVDDKWLAVLDTAIHGEMDRVSQQLTQRVKELAERYQTPMAALTERVVGLEATVNRHLERMGFAP